MKSIDGIVWSKSMGIARDYVNNNASREIIIHVYTNIDDNVRFRVFDQISLCVMKNIKEHVS